MMVDVYIYVQHVHLCSQSPLQTMDCLWQIEPRQLQQATACGPDNLK